MLPNLQRTTHREKLILTVLYLSKFDLAGLEKLGFESFKEAFNVIGYGLGSKPASIKNYRDEFDPHFPNQRKGWHKRQTRPYCLEILKKYKNLDLEIFSALVKSFVGFDENALSITDSAEEKKEGGSFFAKRLITGLAAEHYFESVQPKLPEFLDFTLENTTLLGCGYDFRLSPKASGEFLAVEVKGLQERSGGVALTPKEYDLASALSKRFILFVVKNFRDAPFHEIYRDPLSSNLKFTCKKRVIIQVSWSAKI
jgi:hypothetical protein